MPSMMETLSAALRRASPPPATTKLDQTIQELDRDRQAALSLPDDDPRKAPLVAEINKRYNYFVDALNEQEGQVTTTVLPGVRGRDRAVAIADLEEQGYADTRRLAEIRSGSELGKTFAQKGRSGKAALMAEPEVTREYSGFLGPVRQALSSLPGIGTEIHREPTLADAIQIAEAKQWHPDAIKRLETGGTESEEFRTIADEVWQQTSEAHRGATPEQNLPIMRMGPKTDALTHIAAQVAGIPVGIDDALRLGLGRHMARLPLGAALGYDPNAALRSSANLGPGQAVSEAIAGPRPGAIRQVAANVAGSMLPTSGQAAGALAGGIPLGLALGPAAGAMSKSVGALSRGGRLASNVGVNALVGGGMGGFTAGGLAATEEGADALREMAANPSVDELQRQLAGAPERLGRVGAAASVGSLVGTGMGAASAPLAAPFQALLHRIKFQPTGEPTTVGRATQTAAGRIYPELRARGEVQGMPAGDVFAQDLAESVGVHPSKMRAVAGDVDATTGRVGPEGPGREALDLAASSMPEGAPELRQFVEQGLPPDESVVRGALAQGLAEPLAQEHNIWAAEQKLKAEDIRDAITQPKGAARLIGLESDPMVELARMIAENNEQHQARLPEPVGIPPFTKYGETTFGEHMLAAIDEQIAAMSSDTGLPLDPRAAKQIEQLRSFRKSMEEVGNEEYARFGGPEGVPAPPAKNIATGTVLDLAKEGNLRPLYKWQQAAIDLARAHDAQAGEVDVNRGIAIDRKDTLRLASEAHAESIQQQRQGIIDEWRRYDENYARWVEDLQRAHDEGFNQRLEEWQTKKDAGIPAGGKPSKGKFVVPQEGGPEKPSVPRPARGALPNVPDTPPDALKYLAEEAESAEGFYASSQKRLEDAAAHHAAARLVRVAIDNANYRGAKQAAPFVSTKQRAKIEAKEQANAAARVSPDPRVTAAYTRAKDPAASGLAPEPYPTPTDPNEPYRWPLRRASSLGMAEEVQAALDPYEVLAVSKEPVTEIPLDQIPEGGGNQLLHKNIGAILEQIFNDQKGGGLEISPGDPDFTPALRKALALAGRDPRSPVEFRSSYALKLVQNLMPEYERALVPLNREAITPRYTLKDVLAYKDRIQSGLYDVGVDPLPKGSLEALEAGVLRELEGFAEPSESFGWPETGNYSEQPGTAGRFTESPHPEHHSPLLRMDQPEMATRPNRRQPRPAGNVTKLHRLMEEQLEHREHMSKQSRGGLPVEPKAYTSARGMPRRLADQAPPPPGMSPEAWNVQRMRDTARQVAEVHHPPNEAQVYALRSTLFDLLKETPIAEHIKTLAKTRVEDPSLEPRLKSARDIVAGEYSRWSNDQRAWRERIDRYGKGEANAEDTAVIAKVLDEKIRKGGKDTARLKELADFIRDEQNISVKQARKFVADAAEGNIGPTERAKLERALARNGVTPEILDLLRSVVAEDTIRGGSKGAPAAGLRGDMGRTPPVSLRLWNSVNWRKIGRMSVPMIRELSLLPSDYKVTPEVKLAAGRLARAVFETGGDQLVPSAERHGEIVIREGKTEAPVFTGAGRKGVTAGVASEKAERKSRLTVLEAAAVRAVVSAYLEKEVPE